jgi:hypothetical protein
MWLDVQHGRLLPVRSKAHTAPPLCPARTPPWTGRSLCCTWTKFSHSTGQNPIRRFAKLMPRCGKTKQSRRDVSDYPYLYMILRLVLNPSMPLRGRNACGQSDDRTRCAESHVRRSRAIPPAAVVGVADCYLTSERLARAKSEEKPDFLIHIFAGMGHARTQMTEHYIAEAGLTEQVQRAAWQVAYGHGHPSSK